MTTANLEARHLEALMDLFCRCFHEDHFYMRSFPDGATRDQEMRRAYTPAVRYCLEHGDCRGIWDGEALVAFVLCFDYRGVRQEDLGPSGRALPGRAAGRRCPMTRGSIRPSSSSPERFSTCCRWRSIPGIRAGGWGPASST